MALKDISTPFRTDSEEEVRFAVARFFCDLGFTEQELSLEDHFKIRLGHNAVRIDGKDHNGRLTGRSDLLIARDGKNLAIVETKEPDHELTMQDAEQAVSYARLLKQIAPYAIITNGTQTKVYDVIQFAEIHTPEECIWHQSGQQYSVIGQQARDDAARHLFQCSPEIEKQKAPLGLTGYLSALSKEPPTNRAFIDRDLVGRDEAMDWIRNTPGDRLLVGQPGSGKTSLLYQLSKDEEQGAWFVRTKDDLEIAKAIRETSPKILMLDDAFNDHEFIKQMMRLRNDPAIDGDFSLIATCWNGERKQIEPILIDQSGNACELRRLIRDDMVKVVHGAGIKENIWLVNEIVDQAAGFPGLAVTLADLALRGEVVKIQSAEKLSDTIVQFYESAIERPVRLLLAGFAIGGNAGMSKDTVLKLLKIRPVNFHKSLRGLSSGGVIAEVPNKPDHIKVRPGALRHALIRDVFFSGTGSMAPSVRDALIAGAQSPKNTALELISAKRRGGDFPPGFLEDYISQLEANLWDDYQRAFSSLPPDAKEAFAVSRATWSAYERLHVVWEKYAWLGYDEAKWVIEHFTGKVSSIAPPLLHFTPSLAIPRLLNEAIDDERENLNAHPDDPLKRLEDWVKGAFPQTSGPIRRRADMLRGAKRWLREAGKNHATLGYKVMLFAMIPDFQSNLTDPVSGNRTSYYWGGLTEQELLELQQLWPKIMQYTKVVEVPDWYVFLPTIREWLHPSDSYSVEAYEVSHSFAKQMARDVAEAAAGHIGVMRSLQKLLLELEIPLDEVVATLYPIEKREADWRKQEERWAQADSELADTWISCDPAEVISQLESIELKFSQALRPWPRRAPHVCSRLAEKVFDPLVWFHIMLPTALPADTIAPFLLEASRREANGWEQALRACFATKRVRGIAVQIILARKNAPHDLQQAALGVAGEYAHLVKSLLWSNELPQEIVVKLYEHPDKDLVGELVVAEWQRGETGKVTDAIRVPWEQAFIRCCEDDYWLGKILKAEPALGLKWFEQRFASDSFRLPHFFHTSLDEIMANWSLADRKQLLEMVPDGYFNNDLIAGTVGDDAELFLLLLQQHGMAKSALLSPLRRPLDATWKAFVTLADEYGHTPEEIAEYTIFRSGSIQQYAWKESDTWKARYEQFADHRGHDDDIIGRVAEFGYLKCLKEYEDYKKQEEDNAIHGDNWD